MKGFSDHVEALCKQKLMLVISLSLVKPNYKVSTLSHSTSVNHIYSQSTAMYSACYLNLSKLHY